jgi:hypothetical protein
MGLATMGVSRAAHKYQSMIPEQRISEGKAIFEEMEYMFR